ncbi:MAG: mdtA 3 [Schlesneria sp.]|nr:mdtA 3 [Schlesneria sp.]
MSATQEMTRSGTRIQTLPRPAKPEHPPVSEHEAELKRPTTRLSWFTIMALMFVGVAGLVALFLSGWVPRHHQTQRLEAESHRIQSALPTVRVMTPKQSPSIAVAMLPGDVEAMEEITIYPRTTGYIKRWLADIGDEVQAGQLLAEIDTPEIKAQLQQTEAALAESKASLERAKATANLALITTNRLRGLAVKNTVSRQELDDSENNLAVADANVRLSEATIEANKANVQHIQELLTFCEIRTPFSGTVTARNVDKGKLVTAGNAAGQSLFQLARTNPVRVFVNVPQSFAPGVTKDLKAEIFSREIPGTVFHGVVTRTAKAIDPLTRTLLTEIQVPNNDHALLTGSYVQVRMEIERQSPPLLIPPSALIFNSGGTQVAVVGVDDKVELRQVQVAGDIGSDIGIAAGIAKDERVVINPGDRMSDGLQVEIESVQAAAAVNHSPTKKL